MNVVRTVFLLGVGSLCLALTRSASADPIGLKTVEKLDPAAQALGLTVCNVLVEFDDMSDKLLSIGFSDISTSDPDGFFQSQFGGDTAPNGAFCVPFPETCFDSFVTIGLKTNIGSDTTALDGDWDTDLFNDDGATTGGWFNANPTNTQGIPAANLQVPIAQFTVAEGENVAGELIVFFNDGLMPFPASFECFSSTGGCTSAADCNDDDSCTVDECASGECVHAVIDCAPGQVCVDGACVSQGECDSADDCEDGDLCTSHLCLAGKCVDSPLDCDDDSFCTIDSCEDGECINEPINCDDGNPCTSDGCSQGACVHKPIAGSCNDGNACTTGDLCSAGQCSGTTLVCDDSNVCTTDSCNPASGCVNTPNANLCNDGNACTTGDVCSAGQCTGTALTCDDSNVCTTDSCNPASGCVNTPNASLCSDGDACTTGDVCSAGRCTGTKLDCNDHNACTTDSCNPVGGCVNTPSNNPCDDGNDCTTEDACSAGQCAGKPKNCDDGNDCTDDSCAPAAGCIHTPNANHCDDGDACTVGDACAEGKCAGNPLKCDDDDACTTDGCADGQCVNAPIICPDGSTCLNGECDGGDCPAQRFVELTKDAQGDICGQSYRPVAIDGGLAGVLLTARTHINPAAPTDPQAVGNIGAIVMDKHGVGVRKADCKGSKSISGKGSEQDEELIFDFDQPIPVEGILIGLNKVKLNKIAPVLFITGLDGTVYTVLKPEIASAFTSTGSKKGVISFAALTSIPADVLVTRMAIRETADQVFVDQLRFGCKPCPQTVLTKKQQGNICQDSYRPVSEDGSTAAFVLTARTHVDPFNSTDPNAAGDAGSVVVSKYGAGVKKANCGGGSKAIDGKGSQGDEELILTFDQPEPIGTVLIGLNKIKLDKIEPVLFITGSNGTIYKILKPEILAAFHSIGSKRGIINLAGLSSVPSDLMVGRIVLRETAYKLYVDRVLIGCSGEVCTDDAECNDNDPCTNDTCVAGQCISTPLDCPEGTECVNGECVGQPCPEEQSVVLTKDKQGEICQNSYRPTADDGSAAAVLLTARTKINPNSPTDPNASGNAGSVVVSKYGAGAKKVNCGGSKSIDGKGSQGDEELIFTFDQPVSVASILIGLNKIKLDKIEPVLFITSTDGSIRTILKTEILAAFTPTGSKSGVVNLGALTSVPDDVMVSRLAIRETAYKLYVNRISLGCPEDEVCTDDAECNDNDPCTNDTCVAGQCISTPLDCPEGTECVNGECVGQPCPEEQSVVLTKDKQGEICQNSYRPTADDGSAAAVLLTARTKINPNSPTDPNASGNAGSVVVSKYGAGAKKVNCGGGSKSIDGKGSQGDEELIFTFDQPVSVASILIGLNKIKLDKIEPVLFITSTDGSIRTILKTEILAAFTPTGSKSGVVNLGALTSVPDDVMVSRLAIRETAYKLYVNRISLGCPEDEVCTDDAECNDNDPCTNDTCVAGQCISTPLDCPEGTECVNGECVGQPCPEEQSVVLTKDKQGEICQNSYRPTADDGSAAAFVLTARTSVDLKSPNDPNAVGNPGSVLIDSDGTGVKKSNCGGGSKGISGSGGDQDEELIVKYDMPVALATVRIGLNKVEFSKAEPVFFITGSDGTIYTILEPQIVAAFTSSGSKKGVVDLEALASLPSDLTITQIKIRETKDHMFVNSLTAGCSAD